MFLYFCTSQLICHVYFWTKIMWYKICLFLIGGELLYSVALYFCHAATGISRGYAYVLSLMRLPATPHPSHRSRLSQPTLELPKSRSKSPLAGELQPVGPQRVRHSWAMSDGHSDGRVCPSAPVLMRPPFSPCCVHMSVLCVSVCITALQTGSPVP